MIAVYTLAFVGSWPVDAQEKSAVHDPQIGQSFQIPYRLTDTNHFLVRVRINSKGPFNFLVDSGAPALFIATATAQKLDLNIDKQAFWTPIDRLDFEGGATLTNVKARVEDPFQLVGMNALGLPGTTIDGILGFTILARFRLEIDPTRDRMKWTRLDYEPRDPPVPPNQPAGAGHGPLGVQAMNALGPLAKGLAFLMGKQPEEKRGPRGFLGLEWTEVIIGGQTRLEITRKLPGSPAVAVDTLEIGDQILRIMDNPVTTTGDARAALATIQPGAHVPIVVRRRSGDTFRDLKLTLVAAEGL
jgi:hypothetical protein